MENDRQFVITLFDKNFRRLGWVSNPVAISVTERHMGMSSGQLTVAAADPRLAAMMEPGSRVQIYFGDSQPRLGNYGYRLFSGRLRNPRGSFLPGGTVTFELQDDWRLLRNTLAWVAPENPLEASALTSLAQSWNVGAAPATGEDSGRNGYFEWPAGPIDAGYAANLLLEQINTRWQARFGEDALQVSVAATGFDVSGILPQVRFGTVEDYVVPLLNAASWGLKVTTGEFGDSEPPTFGLVTESYEPSIREQILTPDSGAIRDGEWSLAYPEATDVVVGGPGDLSARAFLGVSDANGYSEEHRDIVEVFREATGAPTQWPTTLDEKYRIAKYYLLRAEITSDQKAAFLKFLTDAGADALSKGAPTSGVSLTLAESAGFRFTGNIGGDDEGFATGDIVSVAPSRETGLTGLVFTDRITETTVSLSKDKGITVTPQVGQRKDDPDAQLADAIQSLVAANNRKNTSQ